jgi:hypothetical protein
VLLDDDVVTEREPQPSAHAGRLCGEEAVEPLGPDVIGNARPLSRTRSSTLSGSPLVESVTFGWMGEFAESRLLRSLAGQKPCAITFSSARANSCG